MGNQFSENETSKATPCAAHAQCLVSVSHQLLLYPTTVEVHEAELRQLVQAYSIEICNKMVVKGKIGVISLGELDTVQEAVKTDRTPFIRKRPHIQGEGIVFSKETAAFTLYGIIHIVDDHVFYVTLTSVGKYNMTVLSEFHGVNHRQRSRLFGSREASVNTTRNLLQHTFGVLCAPIQGSYLFPTETRAFMNLLIQSMTQDQYEAVASQIRTRPMTLQQRLERLNFVESIRGIPQVEGNLVQNIEDDFASLLDVTELDDASWGHPQNSPVKRPRFVDGIEFEAALDALVNF